jgi:hypothetical protein
VDETLRLRSVVTRKQLEHAQWAHAEAARAWDAVGRREVDEDHVREMQHRLAECDRRTTEAVAELRRLDRQQFLLAVAAFLQRVVLLVRRVLSIPDDHRWAACVILGAFLAIPLAVSGVLLRFNAAAVLLGWFAVVIGLSGMFLLLTRSSTLTSTTERRRQLTAHIPAAEARVQWESAQQVRQSGELRNAIEISTRRECYLLAERRVRELEAIVNDQRYRLLHSDWRALRSIDFEEFLAQVFCLLGYEVRMTRRTGDHGADLILRHGNVTVAVQAKGYADPVGPDPIREALMGKNMYRCHYCMAITNSRFTSAAHVEAKCVGCILVAGDQMIDLILGRIGLPRDMQAVAV